MFTTHTAALSSGPVHYQTAGSGPPILHLHPAAGPRVSPVVELLAQRHTVFMPTAPGFNATPVHAGVKTMADLAELMATFAHQIIGGPCDVVAESFGGWVALWLAAKHPDLVTQMVLQGPAGLRDAGTGGVPADPEARMRALYSKPEHAPKETRSADVIAATQRARDIYVNGVDFDMALSTALKD